VRREAVHTLVEGGKKRRPIEQLIEWAPSSIATECAWRSRAKRRTAGAHSARARDSTGREIAARLYRKASSLPGVTFRSFPRDGRSVVEDGEARGALVYDGAADELTAVHGRAVLLATGGLAACTRRPTNPDVATGDGVAMAYRAGAGSATSSSCSFIRRRCMLEGAPRFLLSEALRGEGGMLRNSAGDRFTDELAPRDVVTRAIVAELRRTGAPHVFLDLTLRGADFISQALSASGMRPACGMGSTSRPSRLRCTRRRIYSMGGVRADRDGEDQRRPALAAGEVACTGVHGANRLASNSLRRLVFGARAGIAMREEARRAAADRARPSRFPARPRSRWRALAWRDCGIVRSAGSLDRLANAARIRDPADRAPDAGQCELRNIHAVALLIARCALAREESRGAHYRENFPSPRPEFQKHSRIARNNDVTFPLGHCRKRFAQVIDLRHSGCQRLGMAASF